MSNFRTKLFGLAGIAMAFAGVSYGQVTCTYNLPTTPLPNGGAVLVRSEGTTEQLPQIVISCPAPGAAATVTVQDFVSLPVTSKVLSTTANITEADLAVSAPAATVLGAVSGNTITWTFAAPATAFTMTISNVRVNASTGATVSGAPTAVTESFFLQGPAATYVSGPITGGLTSINSAITAAYVENGLAPTKLYSGTGVATALPVAPATVPVFATPAASSTATNFVVCQTLTPGTSAAGGYTLNSVSSIVQVAENFTYALKDNVVTGAPNNILESEQPEIALTAGTPYFVGNLGGTAGTTTVSNAASSGTRIVLTFANVPAGLTIYLPTTLISNAAVLGVGTTLALTGSTTGSFSAVSATTPSSSNGLIVSGTTFGPAVAAVTVSGGTGTAVYEVQPETGTNGQNVLDTFNIPILVQAASGTVTASSTPMTINVGLGPQGSTNIPNFSATASTITTLTSSTVGLCSTSLLFPFVTNQVGFDTGISIANTSTDPFTTKPVTTPESGTCTMNFYGNGAPTPSAITTPTIASGTNYTFTLSGQAPGFQGYMIAVCSFQYGHAFAFVTNGATAGSASVAQGYLAPVILNGAANSRSADYANGESLGE